MLLPLLVLLLTCRLQCRADPLRQLRLGQRSGGVVYSPARRLSAMWRVPTSRLGCASLCGQSDCLALTYERQSGNCTMFYDPSPADSGALLASLNASVDLEVWSSEADAADAAVTTSAGPATTSATTTIATTTTTTATTITTTTTTATTSATSTAATTTPFSGSASGNFSAGTVGRNGTVRVVSTPVTGCYRLDAVAATGGNCLVSGSATLKGGSGARVQGDFQLTGGDQMSFVVGQAGVAASVVNSGDGGGGGGGGGSFVWVTEAGGIQRLLVAAGGGGGATSQYVGLNATATANGSASSSPLLDYMGAGGTNGGPGAAGQRFSPGQPRGAPGAGWVAEAAVIANITGDGGPGRSRNQSWVGGSSGYNGGFGGGGAGSTAGSAGGGGGYSGGGSGGGFVDAGGAGGSWCATDVGHNCSTWGSSNSAGGGTASYAYLGAACP